MKKLMSWTVEHPGVSTLILFVITGFSAIQLPKLKFDVSAEQLMVADDPDKLFYERTKETFGDDVMLSVIISADDIFREDVLRAIETITSGCEDIDGVTRVVSLSTVNQLLAEDGMLNTDQLLYEVPSTEEELKQLRSRALANPTYRNTVVSKDGKTAGINVSVESRPRDLLFNQRITKAVEELIDQEKAKTKAEIYQVGIPYLKTTMVEYIEQDSRTVTMCALLVTGITLFLFFHSIIAVTLPVVTGTLSVLCTLGFMAFWGFPLNMVNVTVPSLLLIVGSTEDMHLLNEYAFHLRSKHEKLDAIRGMMVRSALAITMTSLTTVIGFATLSTSNIVLIKQFGIAAAYGMFINFVITVLLLPLTLRVSKVPKSFVEEGAEGKGQGRFTEFCKRTVIGVVTDHRRAVLVVSAIVAAITIYGTSRVKVDTDFISFFKQGSELRQRFNHIHEKMAGALNFYIIAEVDEEEGIKNPEVLRDLAALQDHAARLFDDTSSIVDSVRLIHREMNEGQESFYTIPDSADLISQYMLMMDAEDLEQLINSEGTSAAMMIRHNINSSEGLKAALTDIRRFCDENLSRDLRIKFTGEGILVNKASDEIAGGQVLSLSFALVAIFLIITILFMSFKVGLLAMAPNMVPALLGFGVMGFLDIPLNPGTTIVAVIGLGIAVDDTIHFMVRFHNELKSTHDQAAAINKTISHEVKPMLSTSLALAFGLGVLVLSTFVSTVYIGILMPCVMLGALLSDLFVTPSLLRGTRLLSSWDLLLVKVKKEVLMRSMIFEGLTVGQIKKVVLLGLMKEYKDSDHIIRQGEEGREIYLILQGAAEIVIDKEGEEKQVVGNLQAGDIFGEMAFVSHEPRTANVVAKGDVDVLQIDEKSLDNVRERFPKVGARVFYNFSRILSQRVKQTTEAWAKGKEMII